MKERVEQQTRRRRNESTRRYGLWCHRQVPTVQQAQKTVELPQSVSSASDTQKQLPTLQKVQRTVEIPQVECIVGQFIDVPVWQILDETTAAAKLAPHERVHQRTLEQLVDVPVECPPSSRHSKQWKFHHSLSFPTALMKCHLCGKRQVPIITTAQKTVEVPQIQSLDRVHDVQQTQCMDKVVECQLRCHDRLPWSRMFRKRWRCP